MARNTRKFHYRMIGLPRNAVFERLQEEATLLHLPLPTYITVLLIDRDEALQGHGQGLWFPRGVPLAQTMLPPSIQEEEEDTVKMRAVSAATAWDTLD